VTGEEPAELDDRVEKVEQALALIGGRWRPAIMYCLIRMGTQRFNALRRLIPGVSQRMLTRQLRDLERAGLVRRTYHRTIPPRVEYTATDLGRTLQPIYTAVCEWAEEHGAAIREAQRAHDATEDGV